MKMKLHFVELILPIFARQVCFSCHFGKTGCELGHVINSESGQSRHLLELGIFKKVDFYTLLFKLLDFCSFSE